ncbi:MAG: class I SAM-dependent methyltransferase [Actinomycetota bacterium]
MTKDQNRDEHVISHFGGEWKVFNYLDAEQLEEVQEQFGAYIRPLPKEVLDKTDLLIGDFGAGSGRWAHFLLDYAKELWLVEPGTESFALLRERFVKNEKVHLLNETVSENSVPEESLDLAVSLGVLHHVPDTLRGIQDIYKKMKPGGYFLCYLYYALENKPFIYRLIWKLSNGFRFFISKLPYVARRIVCELIAAVIYFPLARMSKLLSKVGISSQNIPLHHYQDMTFYVMRNDAYDRFGTSLEQRFTKEQITQLLDKAGFDLSTLVFSNDEPFWTFSVVKPLLTSRIKKS